MARHDQGRSSVSGQIQKIPTRIRGLDDILQGGLPKGRTTLVSGGPGTGKSIFGLEFLYSGAVSGDPGIFISFEETRKDIRQNALTFGWDLAELEETGKFFLMEGQPDPHILLSGDFNLKGFLAIISGKMQEMGAVRIVIDAMDVLMRLFDDPRRRQNEVLMLHQWLKEKGITAVLTAKKSKDGEFQDSYLDFMADCVIYLEQRIQEQVTTKRLQVVKYRGSGYATNEYPFLVADEGLVFNSISDIALRYGSTTELISSGNLSLDGIMGGGYRRGACILVSGETGTGKTCLASTFALSACQKGERVLYVNQEESLDSMLTGMRHMGIDLGPVLNNATLQVLATMPESMGIEEHLYHITRTMEAFQPNHVVVDAISACKRIAGEKASFDFLMRLIYFCREREITVLLINQSRDSQSHGEISGIGISSIIDTILSLYYSDKGNETTRMLQIKKSRAMKHSKQYHEYSLTDNGIELKM